jgi:hypothetical protein
MNQRRILLSLGCLVAGLMATSLARAGIVITVGPGGGNPDENVLFNKPGLVTTGTTIQGATNQTLAVLDIQSNQGYTLGATNGIGQANVERIGGGAFGNVSLIPHSGSLTLPLISLSSFNDIKFNINAATNGTVTISALGSVSGLVTALNLNLDANGENFFRITATGEVITQVNIVANGDIIDNIKQIRLSGLTGPSGQEIPPPPFPDPDFVPEPASLLVWAAVGAVACGFRCLRRRKS